MVSAAVPFDEAVQILHWIGQAPGCVRAVRDFDAGTFGPLPFVVDWRGEDATVTLRFTGGVVTGLDSVQLPGRFSNSHDWIGEAEGDPLDEVGEVMVELMGLSLRSAAERL